MAITLVVSQEPAMDFLLCRPRIPMKSNFSLHSLQRFSTLSRSRGTIRHDETAVSLENHTNRLTESVVSRNTPCFVFRQQRKWN